jgi:hypothetical protein
MYVIPRYYPSKAKAYTCKYAKDQVCKLVFKDGKTKTIPKSGNNQYRGTNPSFKISNNTCIKKATKEFIIGSNIVFKHTRA